MRIFWVLNFFFTVASFFVATLFRFVARFTRVRIEDSSRNRFALNDIQRDFVTEGLCRWEFFPGGYLWFDFFPGGFCRVDFIRLPILDGCARNNFTKIIVVHTSPLEYRGNKKNAFLNCLYLQFYGGTSDFSSVSPTKKKGSFKSGLIYRKGAECAETNEKSIFQFLVFELW